MGTTSRANPEGDRTCLPDQVAVLVLDQRGSVVMWSPTAEQLFGYRAPEVVGRPLAELWPAVGPHRLTGLANAGHSGSRGHVVTLPHRLGHGVRAALLAFPLEPGKPGDSGTVIVATGERLLRLQDDQAILNGLFSQSPIGLAVYDTDLRMIRMNPALEAVHGIPREQMLGRRISEFLPEIDTSAIEDRLRRVLATGLREIQAEVTGRTPADPSHDHVWSVSSFALTDPGGGVIGVTDAVIDITDRYRARERLALMHDAAGRIGTTLDVTRTVEELVEVLVPRLADLAAVDLLDGVAAGGEPGLPGGAAVLRLAARKASRPAIVEELSRIGDTQDYPADSPHAQSLADGQARLLPVIDPSADWIRNSPDPRAKALLKQGAHSMILVPLRARETTMGFVALHRTARADAFEPDDLLLVQELVARAAVCVDNARRYTREHTTAVTLREGVLPRGEPEQCAVEVARRFAPSRAHAGVNGSWFHVIPLSGARVALVIGDVPGTGVQAAAHTALISSAVRTLAELDYSPDELLARLNDMVPRMVPHAGTAGYVPTVEPLVGAACLCAVYDPISRHCVIASAGHPAPAIADPTGQVRIPRVLPNKRLGLSDPVFETVDIELAEGSTLLFRTASLVRACDSDAALPARLRAIIAEGGRQLDDACQAIADVVAPYLAAEDDLALLLVRTRALTHEQVVTWELLRDPAMVAEARALALRQLDQWGLGSLAFTTELIVSELATNAIRYGSEPIQLRLIHYRTLICEVSDASSTSPHIRRAATTDEGGRGLFLVAQCSTSWGTRYHAAGKTIWAEQSLDLS
jgi:PAS domain S-box-containing protein